MLLVLKNARVIDPSLNLDVVADVVAENGRILHVGLNAAAQLSPERDARVIDCTGLWVIPGMVDIHTHLREPGLEYKEDIQSGTRAAAAGGFTTICAMPNTRPVNDNRAISEMMVSRARDVGVVRFHPIGAVTRNLDGKELTEMADMREGGCVAVSDDGRCVLHSGVMRRALEYARTFDLPLMQHAEDHNLTEGAQMHEGAVSTRLGLKGWPRVAEDHIVARDLMLAEYTSARYHVAHISTKGAVALVREAKSRGIRATTEVTPHHLLLTDESVLGYETACKVNPPLREESDRQALIEALADGTIDCVATDHAPHAPSEKDAEFSEAPNGMIGLETALPLLLGLTRESRLSVMRLVESLTISPARIVGLPVGTLAVGALADITIIDPDRRWIVESFVSKSRNSPFVGREVQGRIRATIVGGHVVYES
ncbi:MAG: dihydroorotase [Deltaproteobacteria bacterium]|nr:dihydroorotase [Deltaproteobacteria bacterium]